MTEMDPHRDQPVAWVGPRPEESGRVVIMIHGRNASPRNILDLVPRLTRSDFSYVAPSAANNTWYPLSFLSDLSRNEPFLSSALRRLDRLVIELSSAGIPPGRIVLLGFSQGACLAAEFAARHAQRFGGLIVFSGGLIGPPGTVWNNQGDFAGTPVFLGCSDTDAHVAKWRVDESADVLERMGADVIKRIYPGMGHVVSDEEIAEAQAVLDRVPARE